MNTCTIKAYKYAIIDRYPLRVIFFAFKALVIWFVSPVNLVIELSNLATWMMKFALFLLIMHVLLTFMSLTQTHTLMFPISITSPIPIRTHIRSTHSIIFIQLIIAKTLSIEVLDCMRLRLFHTFLRSLARLLLFVICIHIVFWLDWGHLRIHRASDILSSI